MAAKNKSMYVCSECGYTTPKWYGKCPGCNEWNTLVEEIQPATIGATSSGTRNITSMQKPLQLQHISSSEEERYHTGLSEFDRVLGGGIVKGSLLLMSGDPGIGKSTILLQICEYLGNAYRILYVSGEESARQIKLRASRLGVTNENLYLLTETDLQSVMEQIRTEKPDIVMIDSIQTMNLAELSSSPGSITQVRECTNALMHLAKSLEIPIILVGHVNKDGAIAGPKVLEHIVDAVLYFEGDRHMTYRILRGVKNRYGSTNEIGVFQMTEHGLEQVDNPSLAMLSGRPKGVSGTAITCVMEGTRPILAEIQALVSSSGYGNPRRTSNGFDYNRIALLLAVLEKRGGYYFSNFDVYVNIVGGLRLDEPAADLAVALALISSLKDVPIPEDVFAVGEIGLGGELRSVSHVEERIAEAARLGFTTCIIPYHNLKTLSNPAKGIRIIGASNIRTAYEKAMEEGG